MVRYQISDLDITNVLVAEFRESIRPCIPQIIGLLGRRDVDVRETGLNTLMELSEHGKISKFPT